MYIGIDVGTSEVKALLLSDRHEIVATSGAKLSIFRPAIGHCEQEPESWWLATVESLQALRSKVPKEFAAARAIGLSGQMHGAVLLDEADRVIRPAILWNDTRSHQECADLMQEMPALAQIAGSLAMPGFTAPKLRWVQRHEPGHFGRIRRVLLPKDFVRLKLTGEHVTDFSDASGTMWLDVAERRWSRSVLKLTGLDERQMPGLVEGSHPGGGLRSDVAQQLGLSPGLTVAGGGGDNAASAIGMGCTEPGSGFVSLGTSGVTFVVTGAYQPNIDHGTHAFCHAIPDRWHQMAVMLTAASALEWAARLLGLDSAAALETRASSLDPRQRTACPIFLPYLSGERTPHNDAAVRGSLHGLDHDSDAARVGYAVIEGIAMGLADGLTALRQCGSKPQRLSLVGGGARSQTWAQLIASAMDLELVTHKGSTAGAALGAARLGWLATGARMEEACPVPEVDQIFRPDQDEQAMLMPRFQRYRSLYQPKSTAMEINR